MYLRSREPTSRQPFHPVACSSHAEMRGCAVSTSLLSTWQEHSHLRCHLLLPRMGTIRKLGSTTGGRCQPRRSGTDVAICLLIHCLFTGQSGQICLTQFLYFMTTPWHIITIICFLFFCITFGNVATSTLVLGFLFAFVCSMHYSSHTNHIEGMPPLSRKQVPLLGNKACNCLWFQTGSVHLCGCLWNGSFPFVMGLPKEATSLQ